jgi:hypothetical protein
MGLRVKHRERGYEGWAQKLNPSTVSPAEMIIQFDEGDATSDYVRDWDPVDPNLTHADLFRWLEQEERNRIG